MASFEDYDEFGNYIGADLESDEEEESSESSEDEDEDLDESLDTREPEESDTDEEEDDAAAAAEPQEEKLGRGARTLAKVSRLEPMKEHEPLKVSVVEGEDQEASETGSKTES